MNICVCLDPKRIAKPASPIRFVQLNRRIAKPTSPIRFVQLNKGTAQRI
jgi:hypothetical protein